MSDHPWHHKFDAVAQGIAEKNLNEIEMRDSHGNTAVIDQSAGISEMSAAIDDVNNMVNGSDHREAYLSALHKMYPFVHRSSKSFLLKVSLSYQFSLRHRTEELQRLKTVLDEVERIVQKEDPVSESELSNIAFVMLSYNQSAYGSRVYCLLADEEGYIYKSAVTDNIAEDLLAGIDSFRMLRLLTAVISFTEDGASEMRIILDSVGKPSVRKMLVDKFLHNLDQWNGTIPLEWMDEDQYRLIGRFGKNY